MGSLNKTMMQTTDLINGVTPSSEGAMVKGDKDGREPHSFPGNLWEVDTLQEETVQMDRVTVNKAHGIQTRQGFLRKAADQGEPEGALG